MTDANAPLDSYDRAILAILQEDNRTPQRAIGERVNLSAPAVQRRIRRMEQDGVIQANVALLDPAAFGVGTEQLSLFAAPAVQELAAQGMRPAAAAREVCEEAVSCLARQM